MHGMRARTRFRTWLLVWLTPLQFVVMVVAGLTLTNWHVAESERSVRRNAERVATEIAGRIAALPGGNFDIDEDRQRLVEGLALEAWAEVIDPDSDAALIWPELAAARTGRVGVAKRVADDGAPALFVAAPAADGSIVRVEASLADVERFGRQGRGLVFVVSLIGSVLTAGAIFLLARRLDARVHAMREGVLQIGEKLADGRSAASGYTTSTFGELAALTAAIRDADSRVADRLSEHRTKRQQQGAMLESMSAGVIAVDNSLRVLRMNRAAEQMLDVARMQARGRLLQEVVRDPGLNSFIADVFLGRGPEQCEFEIVDGGTATPTIVRVDSGPLRDEEGSPVGLLIVLHDVTQLRRLERVRAKFAANVSHELRTPITNIRGYIETLIETGLDNQEQAGEFLETISRNAKRLSAIVDDMLALTHLESRDGVESLMMAATPVREIIDHVILQLRPQAEDKGIQLETDAEADLRVMVNVPLVEQAVGNLIANAIAYSPPNSRVRVTAKRSGDAMVEIAVIDEGPGISAEHLPRIFERFYRVDKGRSRDSGGTGLGLAITKHIALAHGGLIDVESQVGAGSTFRVWLPRA